MKAKNVQSIVCLGIFFLFANQAWAAGWIYLDKTAVGDVYYSKNSIKKVDKSIILVLNKVILSKEAKTKYYSILKEINKAPKNLSMLSYYKKLMEIDCVNRKIKDISVIFYDEKGKVVYASPKSESGEWNDILPDTVGEKLINIVSCEPVTPKEAVVAPKVEEPVTPKEAVAAPKVEEPVAAKEVVAAPKVEEPVAAKEVVAAPKVEEPVTAKEVVAAPKVEEPVTAKEAVVAPKVEEPVAPKEPVTAKEVVVAAPAVTDKNLVQVNSKRKETKNVQNLINKWLISWKSGDMKIYRSCYASDFKSGGMNLEEWFCHRTNVYKKSKNINISIKDLKISEEENSATAKFTQSYSSSISKYSGKKKLNLRKINDKWKIYREVIDETRILK